MGVGLVAPLSIVTFVAVNALMAYVVVPSMDAGYRGETRFGGVKIESVVTSALSAAQRRDHHPAAGHWPDPPGEL